MPMEQSTANKFFALQSSTAGAVVASLLHKPAESPLSIAINALFNTVGLLASEIPNTASDNHA